MTGSSPELFVTVITRQATLPESCSNRLQENEWRESCCASPSPKELDSILDITVPVYVLHKTLQNRELSNACQDVRFISLTLAIMHCTTWQQGGTSRVTELHTSHDRVQLSQMARFEHQHEADEQHAKQSLWHEEALTFQEPPGLCCL